MNLKEVNDNFTRFLNSPTASDTLIKFSLIRDQLGIDKYGISSASTAIDNYIKELKSQNLGFKISNFLTKLYARADNPVYFFPGKTKQRSCCLDENVNCLIAGAGPNGLRVSIELALLGANTVVVEKRTNLDRQNHVKLWSSSVDDLIRLQLKTFGLELGSGSIQHVPIADLQLALMKVALLFGVEFYLGTSYKTVRTKGKHWVPSTLPQLPGNCELSKRVDHVIGADGKETSITGFEINQIDNKQSIGVTAAFVNDQKDIVTERDGRRVSYLQQIGGVTSYGNPDLFNDLKEHGLELEILGKASIYRV